MLREVGDYDGYYIIKCKKSKLFRRGYCVVYLEKFGIYKSIEEYAEESAEDYTAIWGPFNMATQAYQWADKNV